MGDFFAWFTMNKEVQVTNMRVRAMAEEGLLINEIATASDTHWDNEATAAQTAGNPSILYPASTSTGTTWYHAASKKSYSAAAATAGTASTDLVDAYETLPALTAITSMSESATAGTKAARSTMGRSADADAGYYVHYTYYLKASSAEAITLGTASGAMNVNIKSITATPTVNNGSGSAALDSSLRVGIFMKSSGTFYIYAPVTGFTATYYVNASSSATTAVAGNTVTVTDLTSLPGVGSDGTPVEVYLWYEGEDLNCKSDNALATTLDDINVDIVFELKENP
ncbi:MAG: hypothetical protein IKN45_01960 [Lachnospiraceae bacterium]|nr:hypothetical protein [Lachnospiraceae bacterium]